MRIDATSCRLLAAGRHVRRATIAYALLGGGIALSGWIAGWPHWTDWLATGIAMFANTALATVGAGAGLALASVERRSCRLTATVLGLAVTGLGAATLFQHLTDVDLGIDRLLIEPRWGNHAAVSPGRMGPPASLSFTLLGLAVVLLARRRPRLERFVPALGIAVCAIASLGLFGYVSSADRLYAVARYTGIAFQTGTLLLALGVAVVASVPEREPLRTLLRRSAAGLLLRRSLPFIVIVPIGLGWLRIRGERAGWFDSALGTTLLVLMLVLAFCMLLWWWVAAVARHERALRDREGELRHRSEQLETLIDRAPIGVYLIDGSFRICRVNPTAAPTFANVRGGVIGRDFAEVVREISLPASAEAIAGIFRHTLRTGEPYVAAEHAEHRSDLGRTEYFEWRLDRIGLPDGTHGLVCYFRDISQQVEARKNAERHRDALREGERAQRLLATIGELGARMQRTDDLIGAICECVGRELAVSRCGYTTADPHANTFTVAHDYCDGLRPLAGVYPMPLYATPETYAGDLVANEDLARNPRTAAEYEAKWAPLGMRAVLSVPLKRAGELAALFWVAHHEPRCWTAAEARLVELAADRVWLVVERARAEEALRRNELALRESEQRYRAIFDASLYGVITIDEHGVIENANPATERLFGYSQTEMLGRNVSMLMPRPYSDEHDGYLSHYRHTGERKIIGIGREVSGRRKDGTTFPMDLAVVELRIGQRRCFKGMVTDITERKAMERERKELLESERDARAAAEEASRIKDEFLATLSHELRTPLNAILGWCHVLTTRQVDAGTRDEGIHVITRNARAQAALISDLLDMSRIVSGKLRLDVTAVDFDSIVRTGVEALRHAADAKGIRLEVTSRPPARPLELHADGTKLQQVVWNLVSNAVKFTPRGGRVGVAVDGTDAVLRCTVTDTGIGIDAAFLPHVFGRFQQADASTARVHGGLGLGLAIVKHIVELHGGTVTAESPGRGRGATFTVSLPRGVVGLVDPKATPHQRRAVAATDLGGVTVLTIDDTKEATDLIARLLEERHARVFAAQSVEAGLEAMARHRPDIVLCDIGMPGHDGYEFVRRLREQGHGTPAVAVTAFARPDDRQRAIAAGYQAHVSKPVDPAELLAIVTDLALQGPGPVERT